MTVHTIRLAGPWERHMADTELVRVSLPCHVSADDHACILIRKFHRPSGLSDECDVSLVFTTDNDSLELRLNDQPVSDPRIVRTGPWFRVTFSVAPLLKSFNALSVQRSNDRSLTLQSAVIQIHGKN